MSANPFGEVPALPVAVPLGMVVLVAALAHLRRGGRLSWPRAAVAAAIALYAAGIFANTVFPVHLDPVPSEERWSKALAAAAAVSVSIELLQLAAQRLFSGGRVADVNDVIWDVVGGAVGYAVVVRLSRVPAPSSALDRFRWHLAR